MGEAADDMIEAGMAAGEWYGPTDARGFPLRHKRKAGSMAKKGAAEEVPKTKVKMERAGGNEGREVEDVETDIVPAVSAEMFLLMEKRDEAAITAYMSGLDPLKFVYQFKDKETGKVTTGMSWRGTLEASRIYEGLDSSEIIRWVEDEKGLEVAVAAVDRKTHSKRLGVGYQEKMMRLKSGGVMADPFYRQKALSKAQRNALRELLPQEFLIDFMEKYLRAKGLGLQDEKRPEEAQRNRQQSRGGRSGGSAGSRGGGATKTAEKKEQPNDKKIAADIVATAEAMAKAAKIPAERMNALRSGLNITDALLETVDGATVYWDATQDEAKAKGLDVAGFLKNYRQGSLM